MAAGTILITQGTQTGIPIDTIGGTVFPISKIDVGAIGASSPWTGNVGQSSGTQNIGTVNTGTINTGTINTGTINNGTVDTISRFPPANWATTINTTGTALGTIKNLVSGSTIYVTDLTISVPQTSNVAVFSGTAQVIAGTFYFAGNGGVAENYRIPISTTSGSQLTYQQSGTGALAINVQGYVL